jgi:hypothetical protein
VRSCSTALNAPPPNRQPPTLNLKNKPPAPQGKPGLKEVVGGDPRFTVEGNPSQPDARIQARLVLFGGGGFWGFRGSFLGEGWGRFGGEGAEGNPSQPEAKMQARLVFWGEGGFWGVGGGF